VEDRRLSWPSVCCLLAVSECNNTTEEWRLSWHSLCCLVLRTEGWIEVILLSHHPVEEWRLSWASVCLCVRAVTAVLWWLKTWIVAGSIRVPSDIRPSTTPRVWCSICSRPSVEVHSSSVTTTDTHGVRMSSCTAAVPVCRGSAMTSTTQHFSAKALKIPDTRSASSDQYRVFSQHT